MVTASGKFAVITNTFACRVRATTQNGGSNTLELGRRSEMAKMDIKQAYRMVPVSPGDHPLLGMNWQGTTFLDTVLPFGLRPAPKVFNALADALQWVALGRGVSCLFHYLDDYITLGALGTGK